MKILLLTDSLALPRNVPEVVSYEECWPQLLKQSGFDIHQVSIGGATVVDLLNQTNYHKMYDPDVVVIQSGIVDCVPRFASKFEISMLKRIPFLGNKILSLLNQPGIRKKRNKTYSPQNVYEMSLRRIQAQFRGKMVFAIEIAPSQAEYELKVPGVSKNIAAYNGILKKVFSNQLVSVANMESSHLMSDFHHINRNGHQIVFDKLYQALKQV